MRMNVRARKKPSSPIVSNSYTRHSCSAMCPRTVQRDRWNQYWWRSQPWPSRLSPLIYLLHVYVYVHGSTLPVLCMHGHSKSLITWRVHEQEVAGLWQARFTGFDDEKQRKWSCCATHVCCQRSLPAENLKKCLALHADTIGIPQVYAERVESWNLKRFLVWGGGGKNEANAVEHNTHAIMYTTYLQFKVNSIAIREIHVQNRTTMHKRTLLSTVSEWFFTARSWHWKVLEHWRDDFTKVIF